MAEGDADNDAVQVVVRVKPQLEKGRNCIQQASDCQLKCGAESQLYTFDKVAGEHSSQEEIFHAAGEPLVDRCLEGFNCCIFTYGQTGSGKTWTMWGQLPDPAHIDYLPPEAGLIPRIYQKLFIRVAEEEKHMGGKGKFTCKCSIVEIYNETVTDLLNPDAGNLALRESRKDGVYIEGVTQRRVDNVAAVMDLVSEGNENRQVAETNMNRESSRSHVVLICTIGWKTVDENGIVTTKCSRLNLVDLAGSERQKSTAAKGERLKEACGINKSLSTLGHVIMSLGDHQQGKDKHVPYRDSKLTFLLQDSLGGNSKTVMIANLSPALKNMEESLSTLRFARGAKKIKNKAVINESHGGDVTALREEIARLKAEVAQLKYREAERTTQDSYGPPSSMDYSSIPFGPSSPTSNTFTLTDSRPDMMDEIEQVYTLRTEKNCTACRELKYVLKQVWDEKAQVLEDSILLAAQLTAARLELDAAQSEGNRAVEKQKRLGEEVIAQLVSELEIVKGAQKEENASQISHAQARMALARRRSMKAVHSTSCDWSSECGSTALEELSDEQAVLKQLSRERNVMESVFLQDGEEAGAQDPAMGEPPLPPSKSSPDTTTAGFVHDFRKIRSASPANREVLVMDEIKETSEDDGECAVDEGTVEEDSAGVAECPPSSSSQEDIEEHDKVSQSPEMESTKEKEGKEEPNVGILAMGEGVVTAGQIADLEEDVNEDPQPEVTTDGETGVLGKKSGCDECQDEKPSFEGAGGMRRTNIAVSTRVAGDKNRQIGRDIINVEPIIDASSKRSKRTFMNWICCFGGGSR